MPTGQPQKSVANCPLNLDEGAYFLIEIDSVLFGVLIKAGFPYKLLRLQPKTLCLIGAPRGALPLNFLKIFKTTEFEYDFMNFCIKFISYILNKD